MEYPLILTWAAEHPWVAFFLSWPMVFLLLGASWTVATLLTNTVNAVAVTYNQTVGFIAIMIRGYPPERKGKNEKGDDKGEEEEKPLAG